MADPVSASLIAGSIFASYGGAAATAATAGTFLGMSAGTYAAISAGTSGALALMQGMNSRNSALLEKQQRQLQLKQIQIAAVGDSNKRTEDFLNTIASRNAAYGARGVSTMSGTPAALNLNDISNLNENERLAALNTLVSTRDTQLQIDAASNKATNSIYTGLIGVANAGSSYLNQSTILGKTQTGNV